MTAPLVAYSRTPEALSELLPRTRSELAYAIDRLVEWGVPVPTESRLRVASQLLVPEYLTKSGKTTPESLADLCAAVLTAINFRDIAGALPKQRAAAVRRDLTAAVLGPLHGPVSGRNPLQLESQHLVAAALRLGGLAPMHPTLGGAPGVKKPDMYLDLMQKRHWIEVKRPEKAASIRARFDDARDQLESTKRYGGIAIDLTDVLRVTRGNLADSVKRVSDEYDALVWISNSVGYRPGYEAIACTFFFARHANVVAHGDKSLLAVNHSAACAIFGTVESLAFGEKLQSAFELGFEKTGFTMKGSVRRQSDV